MYCSGSEITKLTSQPTTLDQSLNFQTSIFGGVERVIHSRYLLQ